MSTHSSSRQGQDPEAPDVVVVSYFEDPRARAEFVLRVFFLLWMQMNLSLAMVLAFIFIDELRFYCHTHVWPMYTSLSFLFAIVIIMICCSEFRRKEPLNILLLLCHTLALGVLMGVLASTFEMIPVLAALVITWIVCSTLIVFACNTRGDWTLCYGILFVALIGLFIYLIIISFIRDREVALAFSCTAGILFSVFLIFDTQRIMGNKMLAVHPDEYVFASMTLYVDIIMVFLCVLKICDFI